jgi:hypothetical protein
MKYRAPRAAEIGRERFDMYLKKTYRKQSDRFNKKARHENFEFNTNSIMMLLVTSRLLSPGSKKRAFEEKGRYFERFDFSLADVYRALSHYAKIGTECQRHIHGRIAQRYGRDTSVIYYDVTNFCFEIDKADDFRITKGTLEARPVYVSNIRIYDTIWTSMRIGIGIARLAVVCPAVCPGTLCQW